MSAIIATLAIVAVIAIAGISLLVMVISGIHADERRMSLRDLPHTRTSLVARRVLGVYSSPCKPLRK